MRVELVDKALQDFLSAETSRTWGLGSAPDNATSLAVYGIVYRITRGEGQGTWDNPEERREVQYQLTMVGRHHREVSWLSDRVEDRLVGRNASGYKVPMVVAGTDVEDRWLVAGGAIIPSGEDRFTVDDNYRLRVANA